MVNEGKCRGRTTLGGRTDKGKRACNPKQSKGELGCNPVGMWKAKRNCTEFVEIIEGVEAESVVREDEGKLRRAEALGARIDVRAPGPRAFLFFGDPA
jgi:hypothetical protein